MDRVNTNGPISSAGQGMQQCANAPESERVFESPSEFERARICMDVLEKSAVTLRERLAPVMHFAPPDGDKGTQSVMPTSRIAEAVLRLANQALMIEAILQDIHARLEL